MLTLWFTQNWHDDGADKGWVTVSGPYYDSGKAQDFCMMQAVASKYAPWESRYRVLRVEMPAAVAMEVTAGNGVVDLREFQASKDAPGVVS